MPPLSKRDELLIEQFNSSANRYRSTIWPDETQTFSHLLLIAYGFFMGHGAPPDMAWDLAKEVERRRIS